MKQQVEKYVICHRAMSVRRADEVHVRNSSRTKKERKSNKETRPLVNHSFRTWKLPSLRSNVLNVSLGFQAGTQHYFFIPTEY